MKSNKCAFLAATMIAGLTLSSSAMSADLRYAAFVGTKHPSIEASLQPMFDRLSEKTNGELTGTIFPLGQLLGARAILGGIEDGIADGGMIIPQWYPSDIPTIVTYANMAMYGQDPFAITGAISEALLVDCKDCIKEYEEAGARLFGAYSTTQYFLQCSKAVESLADLKGLRVKTTGIMGPRFERLEAVPSNIPSPEMAEGLQRNQLDCVLAPMDWYNSYGLQGIVTNVTEAPMGTVRGMALMAFSTETWGRLPKEQQDLILHEMPYAVADMMIAQEDLASTARKVAAENGVVFHDGDDDLRTAVAASDSDRELIAGYAIEVGIDNYAEHIDTFTAALEKWEGIVKETGHDREAFANALWNEVYSKLD